MKISCNAVLLNALVGASIVHAQDTTSTVLSVVAKEPDLMTLATAVSLASLENELLADERTLFAPIDTALANLNSKYLTPNWGQHLRTLLLFHTVEGPLLSTDITDGMEIPTLLSNAVITAAVNDEGAVSFSPSGNTDGASVIQANLLSDNAGVIHKIDSYLMPPTLSIDLLQLAKNAPGFERVAQLIVAGGLESELQAADRTIFGPSDSAFDQLPPDFLAKVASDPDQIRAILSHHVVDGVYPKELLENGTQLTTLSGHKLTVTVQGTGRFAQTTINGVAVIEIANVVASNGIGHMISQVLLPPTDEEAGPQTIFDVVANEPDLTSLETALLFTGLEGEDDDVMTLFAPTDAALSDVDPKYFTDNWKLHLRELLLFHATPGQVFAADVVNGMEIPTLLSNNALTAQVTGDGIVSLICDAEPETPSVLVQTDLQAANGGVIHKIDSYFVPKALTIDLLGLAQTAPGMERVAQLVATAGLESELRADDRTIFGPSDAAFDQLSADFLAEAASDSELLRDMLSYHVVPGVYPMELLEDGTELTTLSGHKLVITIEGSGRFAQYNVNEAVIEVSNVIASNGIGHLISQVMLPPEDVPTAAPVSGGENEDPTAAPVSDGGSDDTSGGSGTIVSACGLVIAAALSMFL